MVFRKTVGSNLTSTNHLISIVILYKKKIFFFKKNFDGNNNKKKKIKNPMLFIKLT